MKNKYSSFSSFEKDFVKSTKKILDKLNDEMEDISDEAMSIIKKRTRAGYGVDKNYGSKKKLDPLSSEYKRQRKKRGVSGDTRWNKSNLTRTGSMLDNLEASFKRLYFKIQPAGADKDGVSNRDKAIWLEHGNSRSKKPVRRPFLYLSKIEIKRLTKALQKKLEKIVDKLF